MKLALIWIGIFVLTVGIESPPSSKKEEFLEVDTEVSTLLVKDVT